MMAAREAAETPAMGVAGTRRLRGKPAAPSG